MKTTFALLALFTGVSAPTAFAAELSGITLPTAIDSSHLAAGFVVSVVLLTVLGDYARTRPTRPAATARPQKASHALAA